MRSLVVFVGGAFGALARWGLDELIQGFSWPLATFTVNISGAFLLGVLGVLLIERVAGAGHLRAFALIGLLGSYTTFSTMAVEGVVLVDQGSVGIALGYWLATLIAGTTAGLAGISLGRVRT
jgi:CrcB protein